MKTKKKNALSKIKLIKNPYIILGSLILCTGCILYADCILGDKILVYGDWGYDTKHSFLPAYESFVRILSERVFHLYDFSFGLGTVWSAKMMLLFDPFTLVLAIASALCKKWPAGILIVYMQLLKSLIGGELCLFFLKQHQCSDKNSMLSAYVFSFCGYMIATGQHYMFASFLVIAMLFLVVAERFIQKGKYFLVILCSAIIANMGPYFAFQVYLMVVVYLCFRIFMKPRRICQNIWYFFKACFFIGIGLLISMCSFLLQAHDILVVSSRISNISFIEKIKNAFFMVPFAYIKTGVLRFYSNNLEGTVNHWNGIDAHFEALPFFFSTLFVLCVGQFLYKAVKIEKDKKKKKVVLCVFFLFLFAFCNAFIPMFFNVFADLSYRYVFVWIPFFALLLAYTLDQVCIEGIFSHFINMLVTFVSCIILFFISDDIEKYVTVSKYTAIVSLVACALLLGFSQKQKFIMNKFVYIFLFAVVTVELLVDSRIVIYGDRTLMTKDTYTQLYRDPDMEELVNAVYKLEGDNFIRMDRTYLGYETPDVMLSALYPYRSVSIYNSVINANLVAYGKNMFPDIYYVNQMSYNIRSFGMPFNEITASNLGIKYLVTDFQRQIDGWTLIKTCNNRYLYQNDSLHSAGLVYKSAITQSEFEQLDLLSKKMSMSQVIVLEDDKAGVRISDTDKKYFEIEDNAIIRVSNQNQQVLTLDNKNSICLEEGTSENMLEFEFDPSIVNKKGKQEFLSFDITAGHTGNLSVMYNNGTADVLFDDMSKNLSIESANQAQKMAIPLMQDTVSVKIACFDANIRIENIQVISNLPIQYTNNNLSFTNKSMGNVVEGALTLEEDAYLMMPIVFEDGWHVYIDGKEEEVLKANFGFSAVKLKAGKHEVVFKYKSPVLMAGIIMSCIGWAIVCILLAESWHRGYIKSKRPK